jgi:glucose/arabinose dehydrogenase
MLRTFALAAVVACGAIHPAVLRAELPTTPITIETVAEGLAWPWSVAELPDGQLLVTERSGRLRRIVDGRLAPEPVAGVPAAYVASQGGLFDVLPHPDFASNRLIYLSLAVGDARANALAVVRAKLDGNALTEVREIWRARPDKRGPVHYGGRMAWMSDGTLLVTTGDGFDYREAAQDPASDLGKVVRLDADGRAPADNPLADADGQRSAVWTLGHRNAQGIAIDPVTGTVWAHEHGPRGGDELNRLAAGANYGWPVATFGLDYTGARVSPFTAQPGMVDAVNVWTPSIAPAGLAVYRGNRFTDWDGDLLVAALVPRHLERLRIRDGRVVDREILLADLGERLRDVRVAGDGALLVTTDADNGRLLRITPRAAGATESP